ncbi:MAG: hypothetical protein J6I98_07760 [Clostridia bacterium]|nr:hypothetical protein [Clostridia bacterium]
MLKKKIWALLLVMVLILLAACAGGGTNTEDESGTKVFGAADAKDPLRICVDLSEYTQSDPTVHYEGIEDFLTALEQTAGLDDVVIEYLPPCNTGDMLNRDHSARATANDRLRVEIMAGGGPDVFIMKYMLVAGPMGYEYDETEVLFKYPNKAMENAIFLPLDAYMENNTRFTEWDKQTQAVLAAGRNEEGQQIIPLTYTLPLLCYPKTEFDYTPDRMLYWNDMLTDPELSPVAVDLANCSETISVLENHSVKEETARVYYLSYILGDLADYKNEELLFTEEELLQRVHEIRALDQKDKYDEVYGAGETAVGLDLSARTYSQPMTMIPLYSDDGGVTARIQNFAAVNRNTRRPEDAYAVIDLLMSKTMQKDSKFYFDSLYGSGGLPLHEELFQEETPLVLFNFYMTDENYRELCEVREQITHAHFENEMTAKLNEMLMKCDHPEIYGTVEEIVHETYIDLQRRVRE